MGYKNTSYPACVGLTWQGSSRWPWRQDRTEVWTDMISRKYPLHLRLVPNKYIHWDRNGSHLRRPQWLTRLF
jgi:hypothetical protein